MTAPSDLPLNHDHLDKDVAGNSGVRQIVDLVHWDGNRWDPLLMARPAFFRMTIWIDT